MSKRKTENRKRETKEKRAIIIRGGRGIGDLLFTTPIPGLLRREGYQVDVAVWPENAAVYAHHPCVHDLVPYPDQGETPAWEAWLDKLEAEYGLVINLAYTVEKKFFHKTDGQFGEIPPLSERRAAGLGKNYYDETVQAAGFLLEEGEHFRPEIYLGPEEEEALAEFAEEKARREEKVVLWNLHGSTKNKQIVRGLTYLAEVLQRVPQSRHYLVSNFRFDSHLIPRDERVIHVGGQWNLRTSLIMTKAADLVVGPDSALVNAAGVWETPKIVFYGHSEPGNLGNNFANHYPIVPACECSPCFLIPVNFKEIWDPARRALARAFEKECRHPHPVDPYRAVGFHCTALLPHEEVVETAVRILEGK